jgi:molybdate transport system substrate-binding protein
MNKRHFFACLGGILASLILSVLLRGGSPVPAVAQSSGSLLISAAASLQNVLESLDVQFEQTQNLNVSYNFGASGTLQQQIEQGAPADVFISAAPRQMDALQQKNLIVTDTRRNLLSNYLVLIVPSSSPLNLTSFRQLTDAGIQKIAVGEPRSVPVGQYTEELFSNLGILNQVRPKLVYGNSVRNVLAAVESGNADAGVVYRTDARISDRVRQLATAPPILHSPILYPIAVLKNSKNLQAARSYVQFLTSNQAKAVFQSYGFGWVE